jgi:dGTPase
VAEIFMQQYHNILEGKTSKPLVDSFTGETGEALERCKNFAVENIYNHRSVIEIELAGYNVLGTILEEFIHAVLEPHSHYAKKINKLVPRQYIPTTKTMYARIQSILDFISGMTDSFALELYRDIKGISTY